MAEFGGSDPGDTRWQAQSRFITFEVVVEVEAMSWRAGPRSMPFLDCCSV